jgi:hypothetical protein
MLTLAVALALTVQTLQPGVTVRGTVRDRDNGAPLAGVLVAIQDAAQKATTDAHGRFELAGVAPGRRTIYVSLIGFILVKRVVTIEAGPPMEISIALAEGTGTYSEEVTVRAERFAEQERSVPSQQTLGSADILNLRNLLSNDPMRAIQVLPGVTTGDDFRSEFAVRGSGFGHMVFTLDGVPTTFLLHTVQQVRDGGSIAMINGDILSGISLLNGSYPQRYGNRLGAELDFQIREGSRERTHARLSISGTDAAIVAEGPIGASKSGSWLVSARKSYLDFLLKQITDEDDFGFSFSDAQAKLAYDVTAKHRVDVTLVAGRSRLDQAGQSTGRNFLQDGRNSSRLLATAWRYVLSPAAVVTQRVAYATNSFSNTNPFGNTISQGEGSDLTLRSELTAGRGALGFEAGVQGQWQHRRHLHQRWISRSAAQVVRSYDDRARLSSAYAMTRWTGGRASVAIGGRVDAWSLTGSVTGSPWVVADARLGRGFKLRGGAGVHRQFPGFEQVVAALPEFPISNERAYHADAGVEQTVGASMRWQITVYNREERDLLRQFAAEERLLPDGGIAGVRGDGPWLTSLDGYARGVELLVQRRAAAGPTGWLSYTYGVNRYNDRLTHESFDGDFDQRHTFNAYGTYRITNRSSVGARVRAGSNVPAPGYWEERDGAYFLTEQRNLVRVPAYTRVDLRGSRTFNLKSRRLTLFVEVINLLDRENARFITPDTDLQGRAIGLFESMLPRLPSAGILIEF